MTAFSAEEKRQAILRELGFRHRVYARRVADQKMTQAQADREIAIFEEIEADYAAIVVKERLL